jgi:hypothetical protein
LRGEASTNYRVQTVRKGARVATVLPMFLYFKLVKDVIR